LLEWLEVFWQHATQGNDAEHPIPENPEQAYNQIRKLIEQSGKVDEGKWRCEACGEIIPITELHPYGNTFAHTVTEAVADGAGGCYPEPAPCGPVREQLLQSPRTVKGEIRSILESEELLLGNKLKKIREAVK
jgi:hypothetical protein